MNEITTKTILRAIWRQRGAEMTAAARAGSKGIEYDYRKFRQDMLETGTISDAGTIRTKWRKILALDVVGLQHENQIFDSRGVLVFSRFTYVSEIKLPTSTCIPMGGERDMLKGGVL